jgi:deazaflavin-dependent oxidoreductase (nitroreductase family)
MHTELPAGFEKKRTLRISTIGRRTGRRHDVTIWFAVDFDGRLFIATGDGRRDWVKNVMKNPSVEVTIGSNAKDEGTRTENRFG